ncbi:LLM class flavin-dependent oxidoreductase [Ruania alkalisoli]|uniref:LLM class flavin-dependent oxidoreductase n=1 Tax=Ruania alkalisoli TaxID=2779775 RepID=A0A7M1SPG5_9MICO|nr:MULTISPECIES: LLM class flavin-dependent oxidoreductase [Ruania]QOR69450.1 LLM class flavin-dependent oxidoreductase [Ruania alkalisoli]
MPASAALRTSLISLDLSGAGAPREWRRAEDSDAESFIMGRLAGLASLADKGGVDLLTLDETFHHAGVRRRDDWLDGAVAASRLSRHTTGATLVATVPLGSHRPEHVAGAVASVHRASAGRAGWQLEVAESGARSLRAVESVINGWPTAPRTSAGTSRPQVVVPVRTSVDGELAAARADVARLSVGTLEEARAARAAIREAAVEWGRDADDVQVLVDVRALISADAPSARARWDLLTSLEEQPREVPLRSIGTASDLTDLWAEWVHAGAADGFTVIPASVPTDVVALVNEVVPQLEARGLRKPRTATVQTAPAAGRRQRVAAPTRVRATA